VPASSFDDRQVKCEDTREVRVMKMRRFAAAATPVLVVLALTACGGGDEEAAGAPESGPEIPADSQPPTSDPTSESPTEPVEDVPWPCSLVPPEVVGEIYGTEATLDSEESMVHGASRQCVYSTGGSLVTFLVHDMTKVPAAPTTAEEALGLASGGSQLTMVDGIGELAGFKDGALATLYVAKPKGGSFEVAYITGSPEERDQLIGIAEEVAAGM
jgi:hypothetical protein